MGKLTRLRIACAVTLVAILCAWGLLYQATAQSPDKKTSKDKVGKKVADPSSSSLVTRMMAFNKKKDGKLTKDEVTDPRLHRLFDMADTNKDGVITKEELTALAAKLAVEYPPRERRGGPRGLGGPDGGGPDFGGPPPDGGPRGFGPPPRPGQILPPFEQDRLKLTAEQKKKLETLQKEVEGRLAKILTANQLTQLKEMRNRGGRGGPPPDGRGPREGRPPMRPDEDRRPD